MQMKTKISGGDQSKLEGLRKERDRQPPSDRAGPPAHSLSLIQPHPHA